MYAIISSGRHAQRRYSHLPLWIASISGGIIAIIITLALVSAQAVSSSAAPAVHVPASTRAALAQAHLMDHLTPAQAARVNTALADGFAKLGMRAGLGQTSTSAPTATVLTAYDWSGGADLTHAWVTASYANLAPYVRAVNSVANVITKGSYIRDAIVGTVCLAVGKTPVVGVAASYVCGLLAAFIADAAANVHGPFPALTNHGIWGAWYWIPWGKTQGGTW